MNIDLEFKGLIPALTAEEYQGLEQSIITEGCRDALVTWQDTLIDGHNRYEICTNHGIPYKTVEMELPDRTAAICWIINNQLGRRNLAEYVKYELMEKKEEVLKIKGKEKMAAGGKGLPTIGKPYNTQKIIADELGWSKGKTSQAKIIKDKAPEEVKQKLRLNDITINQAYQVIRRDEKLKVISEKIEQCKDIKTKGIDIYNTDRKYSIIYADPAWEYWSGGNKNQSLHYETMTIPEICKLPIKDITEKDCILFLWATYPILEQAFEVIKAWGFEYSTAAFVWVKKNKVSDTPFVGCGSWTRANSELCLLATKGNITRIDAGISQVIESPIEEHSKKPAITRELITRLVGELPRIELFSRQNTDGWDGWGNSI